MCQDFIIDAEDGTRLVLRSMQFIRDFNFRLCTRPPLSKLPGSLIHGLQIQTKYKYIYADCGETHQYDFANHGLNEYSLSFAMLNSRILNNRAQSLIDPANSLPVYLLGDYLLGCFKSVSEIKEMFKKKDRIRFVQQGVKEEFLFMCQPLQASIHDLTQSIMIQFIDGQVKISDNPLQVATNAPDFQWQITNIANYLSLSPYTIYDFHQFGSFKIKPYGHGTGMIGLPGDSLPSSRFVKATLYRQWSVKAKNSQQAVNLGQHLLNSLDTVKGVNRTRDAEGNQLINYSIWFMIIDLKKKVLYMKSYENQRLFKVEMEKIDFQKARKIPIKRPRTVSDLTDSLI